MRKCSAPCYFNPRSYKRSDIRVPGYKFMKNYFNPRSYKRSDESASHFWHKVIISIHAPTRGATQFLWMHLLVHLFQSTLLQEERPQDNMVMQIGKMISIHAPTRGATKLYELKTQIWNISIHAPTRGATRYII